MENGWLGISVEDSGPGVPDELKEKIFEPFVSSRSERQRGLVSHCSRDCRSPWWEPGVALLVAKAPASKYDCPAATFEFAADACAWLD